MEKEPTQEPERESTLGKTLAKIVRIIEPIYDETDAGLG